MLTLDEVKRQIEALPNAYIFGTKKEVKALPEILDRSEKIKGITSGMIDGATWLIVCTDRRLIFINCRMFIGLQQVQMPLDRVQSIDHQFTLFYGSISVFDGINVMTVRMVRKPSILPFVKATEEAIHAMRHLQAKPAAATASQPMDVASQLAKLAELKERGHLTEEEFQAQKKKLLG